VLAFLAKALGKAQRDLRALKPLVARINEIEEQYQKLTDDALREKTLEFQQRIAAGASLDDLLCEAFAAVKNACRRLKGGRFDVCGETLVWDMVPFDSQLMGGIVLHQGKIAEMATGEGKTLVATMPLYLNALSGRNVQLVTVNDYLARRDSQWMGQVYEYLGLTVGCIQEQMSPAERRAQYACDITYGTNAQFGFDYLRDNGMAYNPESLVQRDYFYAIIDEVDSILIDEARTPLIISGPSPVANSPLYFDLKPKVERLVRQQRDQCAKLMEEAKDLLEKEDEEGAQICLYQVHHAMPKHKQLMRMLEDPRVRKLHEQVENLMLTDMRKDQARALRENFFFTIDERGRDASLTDKGTEALNPSDPEMFVLPDIAASLAELDGRDMPEEQKQAERQEIQRLFSEKSERIHTVDQLIRAYCLYEKDVEYVVQDNQVMIVDEFTGRILSGRRWSDGLHQAVEAKEGVKIERETQTLATVTIQNYFRMYDKLAGMTGTAETEAGEFHDIYKLDVVVIPTNRPVRRVDYNDLIYKTQREKYNALLEEIRDCHKSGQPVLVGTVSVDTSEILSRMLKRANIPHNVLNAKNHEREAEIVRRAGQPGSVTIATNMAGRGTDIKLGPGVVTVARDIIESGTRLEDRVDGVTLRKRIEESPCGLHVIGSERHESRRIDRQLRGRCARQGDPGSSRFYVSLEDSLMRLFGSDRISGIMSRLGLEEGQPLEHSWLNKSIERAQRKVEQQNYSIRKRTLQYDDVMNKQREIIYGFRGEIVRADSVRQHINDILRDVVADRVEEELAAEDNEKVTRLTEWVHGLFPIALTEEELRPLKDDPAAAADLIGRRVEQAHELKISMENPRAAEMMERHIVLHGIDTEWQDFLRAMDGLREGVSLRAYGQRDPLVEYKREAFDMFSELMNSIKLDIATTIFRSATSLESFEAFLGNMAHQPRQMVHEDVSLLATDGRAPAAASANGPRPETQNPAMDDVFLNLGGGGTSSATSGEEPKVGRNDPCPCGSGKKYKKCCGQ
jgi:preprotein translocase subunit SecA